jgi:hypothetical protein
MNKIPQFKPHLEKFREVFGISLQPYVHPIYGFELIKFDNFLIEKYGDYMDGKTNMSNFVEQKFGQEGKELLEILNNI